MYLKSEDKDGQQSLMLIALYVNDIVLATNDTAMLKKEKDQLKKRFEIEDQGEIHYCLCMCIIVFDRGRICFFELRSSRNNVDKKSTRKHWIPAVRSYIN